LALVIAGFLGLAACGKFLNEAKDQRQALELDGNFACLEKTPAQITQFVAGEIQPAELEQGIECGKQALVYFSKNTKGSLPEAYAPEDLRKFLGKYFLKENNFSPAFAVELFKLKRVLLGGSALALTKAEIQKLVDLMELLKAPLAALAPHIPRLLAQAPTATLDQLDEGIARWSQLLVTLSRNAELLSAQYSVQDLKGFLAELNGFLGKSSAYGFYQTVKEYGPLLESVKNIFLGEVAHFDSPKDWERAIGTLTGLHLQILRYFYFISNPNANSQQKIQVWSLMIDGGFRVLDQSLAMRQQARIPFKDLDVFLDQLAAKKLWPKSLSVRVIKNLYKTLVLRMLDSRRDKQDARDLEAVERSHFMALHHEWRIFKLHQSFFDELPFDKNGFISLPQIATAVLQSDAHLQEMVKKLSSESLEQDRLLIAWTEGRALLMQDFPALFDSMGRLVIVPDPQKEFHTRNSLIRWNVLRGLSRLMLLGYGSRLSADIAKNKMSEDGLSQWYADFRDLGREMKSFDPRSENSGARSFKEANFFTFHGNGNSDMDFQETFDFIGLLTSGGMVSAESLRQGMLSNQCGLAQLDAFEFPMLKESCFKKHLQESIGQEFRNLPGLVREVQKMSTAEWEAFYLNLMAASRTETPQGGAVETSDLRTAVMLLHYTESLMIVYDLDHNGRLSVAELSLAAPRFEEFMKVSSPALVQSFSKKFPKLGQSLVKTFFLYLVYRGKKPAGLSLDFIWFLAQKNLDSLGEVSRDSILRVFKVLKDEAAKQ
jgi:hypothetical protein